MLDQPLIAVVCDVVGVLMTAFDPVVLPRTKDAALFGGEDRDNFDDSNDRAANALW